MRFTPSLQILAVLLVFLLQGCVKDKSDVPTMPGTLTIGYRVDGMQAGTYATSAEGHELTVNDIHILFYKTDENLGGYVTYQHATIAHGMSTFSFPLPDALVSKTDYQTIIIGNAHSFVPSGYASFDAYLNACKSMSYDEAKQELFAEQNGNSMTSLPMWGQLIDGTGDEIPFRFEDRSNATITGTIRLWRNVCRLDMRNYAANSLNVAWVKVCNTRSRGYYFHNDAPYGAIKSGLASAPPSGVGDGYVRVSEPTNGIQELKAGLYAFSNIVPIVTQNDDVTTYLMIAGYYQDGSGTENTTKLSYYRFNMAELGRSQVLKRNYIYRASIMSVKGAGADTEQGAKDETSPLLEYQVGDEWSDDEDDTVTDEFGNFLILSRTQITFSEGVKNATEVVRVKVKEGMSWEVTADHESPSHADAFSFVKATANSFNVTTLKDNASEDVNKGQLKVTATTAQGTKLELPITLMQLSSSSEMKILLVDNHTGTISRRIPGSGGMFELQVQTGSSYAGWTASDKDNSFVAWAGASFTGAGADKGYLNITVPPNTSAVERRATLLVHRAGAPDVTIELTQPKSDKLLAIFPMPQNGTLVVEGFSSTTDYPNGISVQKEFWVTLADPVNYTYTVTSSFDKFRDLQLSMIDALAISTEATHPVGTVTDEFTGGVNGQKFWINVFRTGPGDPTIRGTITVKAVPKTEGLATHEVSFNVNIVTSCIIGDAVIGQGSFLVADRNVGTLSRLDQSGGFISALNYSNVANLRITGYENIDKLNSQFRGNDFYFSTAIAPPFCPLNYADKNIDDAGVSSPYYKSADRDKWHLPNATERGKIMSSLRYSKMRPFALSEVNAANGKFVGCFFPLAGSLSSPNAEIGYYMTQIDNGCLIIDPRSSWTPPGGSPPICPVRCVRTLP